MTVSTVQKHVELVCVYLKRPAPKKVSKLVIERGRKQLLAIKGITEPMLDKLAKADVTDAESLLAKDAGAIATASGIPEAKITEFQKTGRKKKENAVIQI